MANILPKISIIFPTYNAEDFIEKNLNSIKQQEYPSALEVVIIDNNSKDQTTELIKKFESLNILLIKKSRNLGFAKACNIGVNKASGDFIFITNQDVVFPPDFFRKCAKIYSKLDKNEDLILSPAVIFPNGFIHYYGGEIHYSGISFCPQMYESLPEIGRTYKTSKASGCSIFMKKELFLNINGFDTFFFMYKEDVDFSMRALRSSIPIYTSNETCLLHLKKKQELNDFIYYYLERNRFILIMKHIANLRTILFNLLIIELTLIIHSVFEKKLFQRLKIYFSLLKNFRNLLGKRKYQNESLNPKFKKDQLNCSFPPILLGNKQNSTLLQYLLKILNKIIN
ncbi:MAG: glycosyltransferase [Candidatus Lokiarchaeota archaeon]|nr:glycosyltransferase [Candidatus Lokiarchaeota archaeon]MBD3202206.1 glycosyltransferase [Candidatus Lokiarchaeota archaeon]